MVYNKNYVFLYIQMGLSACFLIGVMLYYYTLATLQNIKRIPQSWKIHISLLAVFITTVGIWKPYQTERAFWNPHFVQFIYLIWGIYIALTIYTLRKVIVKFFRKKTSCSLQEVWLLVVCASVLAIFIAYNVGGKTWYISGAISFSVVSYLLIFFLLFKKNRKDIFNKEEYKYATKKITLPEAELLLDKLKVLMSEEKLYTDSEIKLKNLATKLNISAHKLSQLLNDNLGKSFSSYINEWRVEEAKQLLVHDSKYTLEAIGIEAGFSSKSTFYTTFKKLTGKTPAEYKKEKSRGFSPKL
ncbi:helix-turn-helix domain-containing protein [Aquimarina sp. ERC-38]|uniref:helix-turn-helix domain-containing protein n=1 Tax=Aquimarina sp. ERC-38 TaxID=2949996 RepID=UPI002247FC81|nr:helix-turn-helix domain-containing protein [Aquimarina sp. ERC-38]UZO79843.1 helix-turn-helix domain-containing protein [Aquimarina sp. ERC-38]